MEKISGDRKGTWSWGRDLVMEKIPGDTLPGNTAVARDYVASVCTS